MLYAFGFDRVSVLVSDLYFVDPAPGKGQDSAERGVRLEVRMLERGELKGSIYSAQPIGIGQPVWRADLLESVDSPPGSLDRAHHHPAFTGWEPGHRVFDERLSASPVAWVGEQLSDLRALLSRAGIETNEMLAADAESLRGYVPEIMAAVQGLLDRVKAGELATAPAASPGAAPLISARVGWL
ncbi:MAG: hypothetical protein ABSA03_05690 [Streptosporangiaceae bacterium]